MSTPNTIELPAFLRLQTEVVVANKEKLWQTSKIAKELYQLDKPALAAFVKMRATQQVQKERPGIAIESIRYAVLSPTNELWQEFDLVEEFTLSLE